MSNFRFGTWFVMLKVFDKNKNEINLTEEKIISIRNECRVIYNNKDVGIVGLCIDIFGKAAMIYFEKDDLQNYKDVILGDHAFYIEHPFFKSVSNKNFGSTDGLIYYQDGRKEYSYSIEIIDGMFGVYFAKNLDNASRLLFKTVLIL